jgi:hypothetical protein
MPRNAAPEAIRRQEFSSAFVALRAAGMPKLMPAAVSTARLMMLASSSFAIWPGRPTAGAVP